MSKQPTETNEIIISLSELTPSQRTQVRQSLYTA